MVRVAVLIQLLFLIKAQQPASPPAEIVFEGIISEDVGQISPRFHISFRILDLVSSAAPGRRVCDHAKIDLKIFQFSWDEPNSRPNFGALAFQGAQMCEMCVETNPLDIACNLTVRHMMCGAEGIAFDVGLPRSEAFPANHASFFENDIAAMVSCDSTHKQRISAELRKTFQDRKLSFHGVHMHQVMSAGELLALDYRLPLADQTDHTFPLMQGSSLHLLVNGSMYSFERPGQDVENPFWSRYSATILAVLPEGRHELRLQVRHQPMMAVVLESEPITLDMTHTEREHATPDGCRNSLLCRVLFELADTLELLKLPFAALKYTALGFFLFDWFVPSQAFVPKSLVTPWRRTLQIGIPDRAGMAEALAAHFEALRGWRVTKSSREIVLTHVQWKVTVECSIMALASTSRERSGPAGSDLTHALDESTSSDPRADAASCGATTPQSRAWPVFLERFYVHGRAFQFPARSIEEYLLDERWSDFEHGAISIPQDSPWVRRMLDRGRERLWSVYAAAQAESRRAARSDSDADAPATLGADGAGAHHVFALLRAWKGEAGLAGPARLLQRWMSLPCRSVHACPRNPPTLLADAREGSERQGAHGGRDVEKVCVREDQHAGGREESTGMFGHEVYISHEFRFVWLRVLKSGSSTTQAFLTAHFGAPRTLKDRSFGSAAAVEMHRTAPQYCFADIPNLQKQGSANLSAAPAGVQCLSRQMLDSYFFFAFVRDPLPRFRSALAQADKRRCAAARAKGVEAGALNVTAVLRGMLAGADMFDFHLETQALALATNAVLAEPAQTAALPIDFIGRVEELERDWRELAAALERHAGKKLPQVDVGMLRKQTNVGGKRKAAVMEGFDEGEVDELVKRVYQQDLVCFGPP